MMNNTNNKIELLSPAGNFECFLSAIKNGADAVYLAGEKYGARALADNFSEKELLDALSIAHIFNKKIYLTVNTVIKENELEALYEYLLPFYKKGLDGVIVQDLGAVKYIKDRFPSLPIHASTQMSITSSEGVMLLKELGVCRIVPARELSLSEINSIYENTGIEIETFIHGAMCYAYSGKCFFSSFLGGRSGNRGRCAQPCRLKYNGVYPLSMKDMYTLRILPQLINSGICSFKIEGRMKSHEYVSCVTGIYRKYIDLYYSNPDKYRVDEADEKLLLNIYTRSGNCDGYYFKRNGKSMITMSMPGYNGDKSDLDEIIKYTNKSRPSLCVNMYAQLSRGKEMSLTMNYNDTYVTVTGDIVQEALSNPTDANVIKEKLSKLGGTNFCINEIEVLCDDNVFIPVGKLNELRRLAVKTLTDKLLDVYTRNDEVYIINEAYSLSKTDNKAKELVSVSAYNPEIIEMLLKYDGVDEVIVPSGYFYKHDANDRGYKLNNSAVDTIKSLRRNKKIVVRMPRVIRDNTLVLLKELIELSIILDLDGIMISNYESLRLAVSMGFKGSIIADEHIYCVNNMSIKVLKELGVNHFTYPFELSGKEYRQLQLNDAYFCVYGRAPLMLSANCIVKTLKGCTNKSGFSLLNDRKNADFIVRNECTECVNIIYNSVPTYIDLSNEAVKSIKRYSIRIDFTNEDIVFAKGILEHFIKGAIRPDFLYTKGHFVKGVE